MVSPTPRVSSVGAKSGQCWQVEQSWPRLVCRTLEEGLRMNSHVHSATIYIQDQDRAIDFYSNKLGFEKRHDDAYAELSAKGVNFSAPVETMPWGARATWLVDPRGQHVLLH